jgi:hypothetical protein
LIAERGGPNRGGAPRSHPRADLEQFVNAGVTLGGEERTEPEDAAPEIDENLPERH